MREETAGKTKALELTAPRKLEAFHLLDQFESGEASIDAYLRNQALKAQLAKHAVVYVTCFKGTSLVAGYYTLSNGSVARAHGATAGLRRNAPSDLPIVLLGRMGVTRQAAGQGVATDLLQDAIERALFASESVGCLAMVVHPLNERLEQFYATKAGFKSCPDLSPKTMMLALR
ncbi:acetyltransferase (GNAT) family protein [Pseudomonas sp. 2848]|uniref:GNAT family N-acetyltransferase n=1 Tax=Pseudomonas sp. 2848 TaxID=2183926 RepID=UPI000DACC9F3|nr:GNAT family N-acetyltransferase [Pseudomonas sp. 2848]PZW86282.1 acetyltransferase (GNAT) family protein [Pseudomonas sp. 2848]